MTAPRMIPRPTTITAAFVLSIISALCGLGLGLLPAIVGALFLGSSAGASDSPETRGIGPFGGALLVIGVIVIGLAVLYFVLAIRMLRGNRAARNAITGVGVLVVISGIVLLGLLAQTGSTTTPVYALSVLIGPVLTVIATIMIWLPSSTKYFASVGSPSTDVTL